jgi:hypothetical protein
MAFIARGGAGQPLMGAGSGSDKKNKKKHQKKEVHMLWPKRCQTHCLGPFPSLWAALAFVALFGPVVVNNTEKEKKKHTWGPNNVSGVNWALFFPHRSSKAS